jgi:hypothetical protein
LFSYASPGFARPDLRTMTCQQARAVVQQYKAIVMTTGQYTYERIVIGQGYCSQTQVTRRLYTPTVDIENCNVGNICMEIVTD